MALIRRRLSAPLREPRSSDYEVVDTDAWLAIADDAALPAGDVIVSLSRFRAERELLAQRGARIGVRIPNDTAPDVLAELASSVSLLAIELPTQRDGRAYTVARWLRQRFGFRGELRAVGKVVRDQLSYLARVGFDAFELSRGSAHDALASFDELSVHYQASSDQPLPLWKRAARG
ncbi:MAG: DUF934 domain-containing protein [Sandaracinaceae bacterium]|nr:DUF934 domain-containing protein [Sandaracinaceae bacterium]